MGHGLAQPGLRRVPGVRLGERQEAAQRLGQVGGGPFVPAGRARRVALVVLQQGPAARVFQVPESRQGLPVQLGGRLRIALRDRDPAEPLQGGGLGPGVPSGAAGALAGGVVVRARLVEVLGGAAVREGEGQLEVHPGEEEPVVDGAVRRQPRDADPQGVVAAVEEQPVDGLGEQAELRRLEPRQFGDGDEVVPVGLQRLQGLGLVPEHARERAGFGEEGAARQRPEIRSSAATARRRYQSMTRGPSEGSGAARIWAWPCTTPLSRERRGPDRSSSPAA